MPEINGAALKLNREGRLLTQKELAQRAELSRRTIIRLEAGDAVCSLATVKKLTKALRCGKKAFVIGAYDDD